MEFVNNLAYYWVFAAHSNIKGLVTQKMKITP